MSCTDRLVMKLMAHFTFFCILLLIGDGFASRPAPPRHHQGMSGLVDRFDAFILDQWGVLHDGKILYPDVLSTLQRLKVAGKKLIMLSNSSKRKASSIRGLAQVGIDPLFFFDNDVVTSGEVCWQDLSRAGGEPKRIFLMGNGDNDEEYVGSLGAVAVLEEDASQATLVLARGTFSVGTQCVFARAEEALASAEMAAALGTLSQRGVPMLVSNPDTHRPGSGAPMPGQIALRYAALGGAVRFVGKPHSAVFDTCMELLPAVPRDRVCMVGDSLSHDVLGAVRYGLGSCWVMNGVHAGELGTSEGGPQAGDAARIEALLKGHEAMPQYAVPAFQW